MIPGFLGQHGYGQLAQTLEIKLGRVVDVHPKENSIDVRLLKDNRRLTSVPVVGLMNTGTTGMVDLAVPDLTTGRGEDSKWESVNTDKRDAIAVIGFADGAPLCLGFVMPPLTEMTLPDDLGRERRLYRHASDVYNWIDKDGNSEWCHPSATWMAATESPQKLKFTKKDYDRLWKVKRNLDRALHGVISWWHGGEKKEKARLHLKPIGDLFAWLHTRLHFKVGPDHYGAAWLRVEQSGEVTCHADPHFRFSVGTGGGGGATTVATPSFQSDDGEQYQFDGAEPDSNAEHVYFDALDNGDCEFFTIGNYWHTIEKNESRLVKQSRSTTVQGEDVERYERSRSVSVSQDLKRRTGRNSDEAVGGNQKLTVGGSKRQVVSGHATYIFKGGVTIVASSISLTIG